MRNLSRRTWLKGAGAICGSTAFAAKAFATPTETELRGARLRAYFLKTVPSLLRNPEGPFNHPSLAISPPGKNYSTELWDWDTLWIIRSLLTLARWPEAASLRSTILEHSQGSLLNFLDKQAPDGRIPIMISVANKDPFHSIAPQHPTLSNQAKPVFAQIALSLCEYMGNTEWLRDHFEHILLFLRSWKLQNMSETGLYVWTNDVAIGDDNDPTTWGRPAFSSANLMLNCLFYQELQAAAKLAKQLKRSVEAQQFQEEAVALSKAIERECWEPRDSFYYTVDTQVVDHRAELLPTFPRGMDMTWKSLRLRVQMFTGFMPLWCGFSTQERATSLVRANYLADDRFRCASGLRSLSNQESMYALAASGNPSNWLGPVWTVSNYFTWVGLKRYGFTAEARELAEKTIKVLSEDLEHSGSLNEYYHPDTGVPLSHTGFIDWNMLVLEML